MARVSIVILSLCLLGCTTSGDSPQVKAAEKPIAGEPTDAQVEQVVAEYNESVPDKKDKVICTRETVLGSHFSRRVCRTVHQMEEDRAAARTAMDEYNPASGSDGN